jgi:hypothetical protein
MTKEEWIPWITEQLQFMKDIKPDFNALISRVQNNYNFRLTQYKVTTQMIRMWLCLQHTDVIFHNDEPYHENHLYNYEKQNLVSYTYIDFIYIKPKKNTNAKIKSHLDQLKSFFAPFFHSNPNSNPNSNNHNPANMTSNNNYVPPYKYDKKIAFETKEWCQLIQNTPHPSLYLNMLASLVQKGHTFQVPLILTSCHEHVDLMNQWLLLEGAYCKDTWEQKIWPHHILTSDQNEEKSLDVIFVWHAKNDVENKKKEEEQNPNQNAYTMNIELEWKAYLTTTKKHKKKVNEICNVLLKQLYAHPIQVASVLFFFGQDAPLSDLKEYQMNTVQVSEKELVYILEFFTHQPFETVHMTWNEETHVLHAAQQS